MSSCEIRATLQLLEMFPSQIVHILSIVLVHPFSLKSGRQFPLHPCFPTMPERLCRLKIKRMLTVKCMPVGVATKKSVVSHLFAGQGLFAAGPVGKRTIMGYYYGHFVYEECSPAGSLSGMHSENKLKRTKETFMNLANRLPDTVTDKNMVQQLWWRVSAPFCTVHYDNDGRYLPEDETPEGAVLQKKPRNNSELYQIESRSSCTPFTSYKLLITRAFQC